MLIMIALMAISVSAIAQDVVKNGTIYKKHPYITKIIQLIHCFLKAILLA
jgi:flagellin-specific chaperone FliS